jgi:hypothetical protein
MFECRCDERLRVKTVVVCYESIKRELKRRPIYECRCDERLKTKAEGSTRLAYTPFTDGPAVQKRDFFLFI